MVKLDNGIMGIMNRRKIQMMVTCLVDTFFPLVGESVVDLLEQCGLEVSFPKEQTCCGQPAFNAGYWQEARSMAIHTLDVFSETVGDVIIPSGSCAAMIKNDYLLLFQEDAYNLERAKQISRRTYELSQYLVDILGFSPMEITWQGKVAYHPSCHLLRGIGVDTQPKKLLESAGAQVIPLEPECCGFGGVFSVDFPDLSEAMLDRKLQAIKATGADLVVGADVSCLMHIEGGLRREKSQVRCAHFAQLLTKKGVGLK